jgi:hypothetical protein
MEGKSMNISNSNLMGNYVQGSVGGDVKAHIESTPNSQSSSNTFNNNLHEANVANLANQVSDNAQQQANQHIYGNEQRRTLSDAAKEIQKLLKHLEISHPTATETEKISYIHDETTPGFKRRVIGALQAGSEAAIEEFLDNPYVNVGKAVVKGWVKPE